MCMTDFSGNTLLMFAIYYKREIIIRFLLENVINTIQKINKKSENAFVITCKEKNWNIVEYILNKLPNNNLPNNRLVKYSLE